MIKWLATFIILWFIYQVREVFPPIIVGGIIAYLLLPLVNNLSKSANVPKGVATAIVYLLALTVLGCTCWYLAPAIVKEIADLAQHKQEIVANVISQIAAITHWSGDVQHLTDQILDSLTDAVQPSEVARIGTTVGHGALQVLVCVVSSIYFTNDSATVGRFFLRYLPAERREEAILLAGRMNTLLSNYVNGQLILIALMSSVAWIFLNFFMHMKYALPVAIFSGFLEIIPVLGPILAISTAVIVGIWQLGAGSAALIIGFYTIARWIEDYVVVPKIIGHAVELHPLAVIFAVLCGEHLAGALGMLIAIPVAACVKLFIDFFYFARDPHCTGRDDYGEHNKKPDLQKPLPAALAQWPILDTAQVTPSPVAPVNAEPLPVVTEKE